MDFYLSFGAVFTTILTLLGSIFMFLGAIFSLLGIIFTHLGTISKFLGVNFNEVYGKIKDLENKITASLPSSPSLRESPEIASSSIPPSPLRASPLIASSSLPLSPPSPPSLLCESLIMDFSSSLSPPSSPTFLCESSLTASSSSSLSTPSSPSLLCESSTMASSALSHSLPSSSPPRSWEHDVFPSFHGPDVHKSFLSHIQREFQRNGIPLFIDNEIRRGKYVGPELKKAIRGSKFAIVLLSKNYACSSWCLDELVEIMINKVEGQTVITIFYEVAPADVRNQTGDFGKVFKETCQGQTLEKIEAWRNALAAVASITGYHSTNSLWVDEATMIENIAAEISKRQNRLAPSPDMDRFIGMGDHMERMKLLLRLDLHEVRMVGIWGPPGIGKSTIARVLFNHFSSDFLLSAIMMNIKESYQKLSRDESTAQLQLQHQLLSQIINYKGPMITHLGVAKERLKDKNVLLVLDDVDQSTQLDALASDIQCFGPRSRIIITTEDRRVLKAKGINHIYKVDYPIDKEALQIFCMHAFGQKFPYDGFEELAQEVTKLSGKLPLGLTVMGSYLRGMSKKEWTMALPVLRNSLDGKIESVLKFSYDALCEENKKIFLHIACYFNHWGIEKVEEHLANKFLEVRQRLQELVEKSLIRFVCEYIIMHRLLAQLGKEIVRKQSLGEREFLMDGKDIGEVLTGPLAIPRSVKGIYSSDIQNWDKLDKREKVFKGMSNLKFLRFEGDFNKSNMESFECLKYTSPKLQLLEWKDSPMTSLPFISNLEFLVELSMTNSKLEKLWDGIKLLQNLKRMDLSSSRNLKELPNLSTATNLEELQLGYCSSLVKLPSSIGDATNLQILYLSECSSLVDLPSSIGNATNLQRLHLNDCSSLVGLPFSIGDATNLQYLDLNRCSSLVKLPSSIGNLNRLKLLYMVKCTKIEVLPTNINLKSLIELLLTGCSSLKSFPEISTNIEVLSLKGTAIEEVPSSIISWSRLKKLSMSYIKNLQKCPHALDHITDLSVDDAEVQDIGWVKGFSRLHKLELNGLQKLISLPQLPYSLSELDVRYCESLERLECSLCNPKMRLNFQNCFKLNQEARDLIIQTSNCTFSVLPNEQVPACFTYRAPWSSVTVTWNEKPLCTSTKFKACSLLEEEYPSMGEKYKYVRVECIITSKQNARTWRRKGTTSFHTNISEHLYIFDFQVEDLISTELVFEFKPLSYLSYWKVKECGILQLL